MAKVATRQKGATMANILVLSQYWVPENGVPQRRWSWLTGVLKELGHEVAVIAPPAHYNRHISYREWLSGRKKIRDNEELGPNGEKIFRCAYLPSGDSLTGKALNQAVVAWFTLTTSWAKRKSLFRSGGPDIVIGTVPALPTSVTTALSARLLGVPYVIDLRDAWPDLLRQSGDWNSDVGHASIRERMLSLGPKQIVFQAVEKVIDSILLDADGVITTAESLSSRIRQDFQNHGNYEARVVTIRNVFPIRSYPDSPVKKAKPAGTLNILYAGTLGRAQKLSNAVEAVRIAQDAGYDVCLRLVGAGAAKEALRSQIQKLGVNVELIDRLPADELAPHYQWADVALVHLAAWESLKMAVPSKTYELIGNGIFITAAIAGETVEVIEKLEAGVAVEPESPQALADAWIKLAQSDTATLPDLKAPSWVKAERETTVPKVLAQLVEAITESENQR